MLVYRARLGEAAGEILAVSVRPRPAAFLLGDSLPARLRVIIRYALPSGAVHVHRGDLCGAGTPRPWVVAGYQLDDGEVLVSLIPASPAGRQQAVFLTDQVRLPFAVTAWGVTRLEAVQVRLDAVCRAGERAVTVRGTVRLELVTPGVTLRLRIPFCRLMAAEGGRGLRWQVWGAVTRLKARVEPGGQISGEMGLTLRCAGRPAAERPQAQPASRAPVLALVRGLEGRILRAEAEPLDGEHVLARGTAELDLYWIDEAGRSRWTGRTVAFAAVLPLKGVRPDDRLEAVATVERLTPVRQAQRVTARLVAGLRVTALRDAVGSLGTRQYRLQELAGEATGTAAAEELLLGEPASGMPGPGGQAVPAEVAAPEVALPEGVWSGEALAAEVGVVSVSDPAAGRWQTPVFLNGALLGPFRGFAAPDPAGAQGMGRLPAIVAGLERLDGQGIRLKAVPTGSPGPEAPPLPTAGTATFIGEIDLPGPVRSVLGLAVRVGKPWRVRALVAPEAGAIHLAEGPAGGLKPDLAQDPGPDPDPGPARLVSLTAMPVLQGDRWRLRFWFECSPAESAPGNGG